MAPAGLAQEKTETLLAVTWTTWAKDNPTVRWLAHRYP